MSLVRLPFFAGLMAVFLAAPSVGAQEGGDQGIVEILKPATAQVQRPRAQASNQVELSLDEAIARALERNLDIAVERLNPQVLDLSLAQVYGFYRPTFTTSFSNTSRTNPSQTQLDGGQRVVSDTATVNSSLNQAVPWGGGSFQVSWNNTRTESTNTFLTFNPSFRSNFQASYTQPLLRGFAIDSTRQQLQVTRLNREISDVDLRQTMTSTVANVRNAYWDLAYAVQAVEVQRQALELAEQLIQDNRARVEIGTMAPIDIVQSQSEAAARRQSLVQAEQNLRTAELALKQLIVDGTTDELWLAQVRSTDLPTFNPEPIDLEAAIRTALDQRTDLIRSRRQLDINDINLRALRNDTLPSVDLIGTYQLQGQGGTQTLRTGLGGNVAAIIPGGFGNAIDQLVDTQFPVWNVQVQVSYPLGQSAADAAYARARVQTQQTQVQIRQLELQVATEVTNAAVQLESILERIDASRSARELAEQQLDAEQSKFEVGTSTNFFVVQAQRDVATAQDTELRALLDYQKALVNFERAQQTSLSGARIIIVSGGGGGA